VIDNDISGAIRLIYQIMASKLHLLTKAIPGCKFSLSWEGQGNVLAFDRSSMSELLEHLKSRIAPGLAAKTGP
jgi:hypothetical protein